MSDTVGVSVIIPTYNRVDTLPRAVESVMSQGDLVSEVIIVDDGSSDGTATYLQHLCALEPDRVKIITNSVPGGAAAARNAGIAEARFDLVAFQDSDDLWLPGRLEAELAVIRARPDLVFVASRCVRISSRGAEILPATEKVGRVVLADTLGSSIVSTQTLLVRTRVLRDTLFDETLRRFQDWDLVVRLSMRGPGLILGTPRTLVFVQGDSLSGNPHEGARARLIMLRKYATLVQRLPLSEKLTLLGAAGVSAALYLEREERDSLVSAARLVGAGWSMLERVTLALLSGRVSQGAVRRALKVLGRAQVAA